MIYIQSNARQAADNFALEYWLTKKGFDDLTFSLWTTTPTIMLGKFQDALAEVNLAYADQHDITVSRRLSGGGTIFTDRGSFQYSFIKPSAKQTIDFNRFLSIIGRALKEMGLPVEQSSRNDLILKGRKFSGNAQYNCNGYVVHHGSLLFDSNLNAMTAALHVDPVKLKAKRISSVHQRVLNIRNFRSDLTREQFAAQLKQAVFQQASKVREYHLTVSDRAEIRVIKDRLFANPDFIYGKTPPTTITKERYFVGGGLVKLALAVEHGYLKQIHITGDFFSNLDVQALESALTGTLFQPQAIRPILNRRLQKTPIQNIDPNQLLDLLFA